MQFSKLPIEYIYDMIAIRVLLVKNMLGDIYTLYSPVNKYILYTRITV